MDRLHPPYVFDICLICASTHYIDKGIQTAEKLRPDGCFHGEWEGAIKVMMDL